MATQATYDDANLILRLYELRREEKLRKARQWFAESFHAQTAEEAQKLIPPGSEENAYYRMVLGYWDMAASFVARGILHQELFFENCGEFLFVWERVRHLLQPTRDLMKNPNIYKNFETVGNAYIEYFTKQGPEAYSTWQGMMRAMANR